MYDAATEPQGSRIAPLAVPDSHDMSAALAFLRTRGEVMCRSEFTAPWAVSFVPNGAHLHLVERGSMFVVMPNADPVFVEEGGLVFIGPGKPYRIASATDVPAITIRRALRIGVAGDSNALRIGGGGIRSDVICTQFALLGVITSRIARHLPELFVIHPDARPTYAWLAATIRFLIDEVRHQRTGVGLMTTRLLDLLLVQLLRTWAEPEPGRLAWLGGLDDPHVGRVIAAIHADPARDWNVRALASIAGLGRSAFVEQFKRVVGEPPARYVTRWRLYLGAELLRAGAKRIVDVATQVGYGSETAFSHAFRAEYGVAPGAFRRKTTSGRKAREEP